MNVRGKILKPTQKLNSSRVRQFILPGGKIRITQITTFCPDIIGPGPTHLYLIESEALILLDTGIPTYLAKNMFYFDRSQPIPPEVEALPDDHSKHELLEGLNLVGYDITDIDLLVISHGHPDHFFMGRWISEQANCPITAHALDTAAICNPWEMFQQFYYKRKETMAMGMPQPKFASHYDEDTAMAYATKKMNLSQSGIPRKPDNSIGKTIEKESMNFSLTISTPLCQDGFLPLNGSLLKEIEFKHLPGHSPGGIGLILGKKGGEKILLCGDVLLSPITPHPNNLLEYLRTLEKLKNLKEVVLVLPAHGRAITDIEARVSFLQRFHRQRLKLTYDICKKPCSVWQISTVPRYFKTYVDPEKYNPLAGTEALVHIELLQMVNGLQRVAIREGVCYFQNSGEPFGDVYTRILETVQDRKINPITRY